jgi:hypothetical protein
VALAFAHAAGNGEGKRACSLMTQASQDQITAEFQAKTCAAALSLTAEKEFEQKNPVPRQAWTFADYAHATVSHEQQGTHGTEVMLSAHGGASLPLELEQEGENGPYRVSFAHQNE